MREKVGEAMIPRGIRLTSEDEQMLRLVAEATGTSHSDIIRWAIRCYCLSADVGLIDGKLQRQLRDDFGHLSIGPASWSVARFQAEANDKEIISHGRE